MLTPFNQCIFLSLFCFTVALYVYCLLNDKKKKLKKFDPRTWCTKKPYGYRVILHGYSLMSCPGQHILNFKSRIFLNEALLSSAVVHSFIFFIIFSNSLIMEMIGRFIFGIQEYNV